MNHPARLLLALLLILCIPLAACAEAVESPRASASAPANPAGTARSPGPSSDRPGPISRKTNAPPRPPDCSGRSRRRVFMHLCHFVSGMRRADIHRARSSADRFDQFLSSAKTATSPKNSSGKVALMEPSSSIWQTMV